ncbi:MAG TPA: DUF5916 domain-containing protein [Gemmatimonadaceae bacterium]
MLALAALLALVQSDTLVAKSPEELRVRLPRVESRPELDGSLDDRVWREAATLERFVQFQPRDQVPASRESIGYVAYDGEHLYFAFRAWDAPGDVRATIFPRERGGGGDDRVELVLDTFLDQRRAYQFRVTPHGIQWDAVKTEGSDNDESVDFVWRSAGRVLDDGWSVEVAIPFASLRFPRADTIAVGVNVIRFFGRTGEQAAWAPRRIGHPCDICQQGVLAGITGIERGRTLDLLPYVSAAQYGARAYGEDSALVDGAWHPTEPPLGFSVADPTAQVGADLRLSLTSALVLNATINPDFSQVEADEEQIRTNRRFALFLAERRPFFLEGGDIFRPAEGNGESIGTVFYSRAIVDPSAGARITGKQGKYTIGALWARDATPAYFHYDGYESGDVVAGIGRAATVGVARVRRDVLDDSYVGLTALGRDAGDARSTVLGADVLLRAGALSFSAEGGASDDRAPLRFVEDTILIGGTPVVDRRADDVLDGRRRTGSYYRASLTRQGRSLSWVVSSTGATEEFRNQLGEFERVGVQAHSAGVELTQYVNNGWLRWIEETIEGRATTVYGGKLLDYVVGPEVEVALQRQTSFSVGPHFEQVTIADEPLEMVGAMLQGESAAWKHVELGAFLYIGGREIVDFDDPRVGRGYVGNVGVTFRPTARTTVEGDAERSIHYEAWGEALVADAKILRLRGTYQFTRALGLRLLVEHSDQFDSKNDATERRDVELGSSVLLSYELAPASFLYLGWNDASREFDRPVVTRERRMRTGSQLFLKVSYLLRM